MSIEDFIIADFCLIDDDKAIWEYFYSHWRHFFPNMPDRFNFAKQAANLHIVKKMLQARLATNLGAFNDSLHLIDGLPMPVV